MKDRFITLLHQYLAYIGKHRYLLLLLYVLSILSIIDIPTSPTFKIPPFYQVSYIVFVGAFKSVVLLSVSVLLLRSRWGRIVFYILLGVFIVLSLTNAVSLYFYGMGITRKFILILAQTTRYEASDFLVGLGDNLASMILSRDFLIVSAAIIAALYFIRRASEKVVGIIALAMSSVGLVAFGVYGLTFTSGRTAHSLVMRIAKYGKEVWDGEKAIQAAMREKTPLPFIETVSSRRLASVVVVVIGESAHRRHHSLYGYALPTTPCLDMMADSLIVFSDVIGSSVSTAGNMERILSFKTDDMTSGDGLKFPPVVDLFNEMGYTTFWLSNQERTGTVSNTSGVMTMNASEICYVGAENSEDALNLRFDGELLPLLDKALERQGYKLIFLHLLGSHVNYKSRYPDEFEHFTASDEISVFGFPWLDGKMAMRRAQYDNSIRYTDNLLYRIIGRVSSLDAPAVMLYFSDHGEEVYDFGPSTGRNADTVQVPFLIYANNKYRVANDTIVNRLNDAKDRPFSTANIEHLLISMTGGEYALYDPRLDVSSPDYESRPRNVDEAVWRHDVKGIK